MGKCKKIKRLRIGNYFRELSVVIIGVAVTLYASGLIGNAKERKELQGQMEAIHSELEYNLHEFEDLVEYYSKTDSLKKYMRLYHRHPTQANADSVDRYSNFFGQIKTIVYQQGAYDMFWNSGNAKVFTNKELLLDITNCYAAIERTLNMHGDYSRMKMELIAPLYNLDTDLFAGQTKCTDPQFRPVYNFHLSVDGAKHSAVQVMEQIQATLSKMSTKNL